MQLAEGSEWIFQKGSPVTLPIPPYLKENKHVTSLVVIILSRHSWSSEDSYFSV